jgi:hypothetical protein
VIGCATDGLILVKAHEGRGERVALGLSSNGAGLCMSAVFFRTHQPIMSCAERTAACEDVANGSHWWRKGGLRSQTHAMPIRILALTVGAAVALVSCGSATGGDQPAHTDESAPIVFEGRNGAMFYPRDVPGGTMSAQAAYNAMRRQDHPPQADPGQRDSSIRTSNSERHTTLGKPDARLGFHVQGMSDKWQPHPCPYLHLLGVRQSVGWQGPWRRRPTAPL